MDVSWGIDNLSFHEIHRKHALCGKYHLLGNTIYSKRNTQEYKIVQRSASWTDCFHPETSSFDIRAKLEAWPMRAKGVGSLLGTVCKYLTMVKMLTDAHNIFFKKIKSDYTPVIYI